MLPYIPGLGSAAAGTDEDADILDQTEPVGSPFRARHQPQMPMRFEQMSPRSAQQASERALLSFPIPSFPVPAAGSPHDSLGSRRSNAMFGSPVSASPTAALEAERQWWIEASERQIENLSQVVHTETTRCFAAMDQLKAQVKEDIRQEAASLSDQFGALLNSVEQRLRREQQAGLEAIAIRTEQAMLEVAREHSEPGEKLGMSTSSAALADAESTQSAPTSPSVRSRRIDSFIEEIGLRVDGLHVRLEEQLTTGLAEERKNRGKALTDVCQYIEHMVGMQESDANVEKRRMQDSVADLENRVQVLEEAVAMYLYQSNQAPDTVDPTGSGCDMRPSTGTIAPGSFEGADVPFPTSNGRSSEESASPPNLMVFRNGEGNVSGEPGSSCGAGMTMPLFSEDMKESLKHIVRKVGDTMSKDSKDTRENLTADRDLARGSFQSAQSANSRIDQSAPVPTVRAAVAATVPPSFQALQSQGAYVAGPSHVPAQPQLRFPANV